MAVGTQGMFFFSLHLVMIMMVMAMLMQVWDMFCCEGVKVLFRVALVLIKHALPRKVSSS